MVKIFGMVMSLLTGSQSSESQADAERDKIGFPYSLSLMVTETGRNNERTRSVAGCYEHLVASWPEATD
jgi:hypothetical protein